MKCVVLLALVAVSSAYPYQTGYNTRYGYSAGIGNFYGNGKHFNINGDGSVTVTTATGKKITISRGTGQNNLIDVTAQDNQGYQGQYYNIYQKYQPAQVDILDQILTQYQGDVSQNAYQQLLGDVNAAVQNGQLDTSIYNALLNVNQIQNQVEQIKAIQQLKEGQVQQLLKQQIQNQQVQQHGGNYYGQDIVSQTVPFGKIQDILGQQLYNQYQGDINQNIYQQLLDEVNSAVQNGQLDNSVYKLLLNANQVENQAGKYQAIQQLRQAMQVQQQLQQQTQYKQFQDQGINQEGQAVSQTLPYTGNQGVLGQQLYQQYGQQVGSVGQLTNQLSQLIETEKVILNHQNQIHEEQKLQHQQQEQLTQQQLQQQEQQHQQQVQQQYVQQLQQQVQKEQEQVLDQQKQQQQQQYLLNGASRYTQTGGQQTGFLQYYPNGLYQGGLYGVYGQGLVHHNVPLVH